ncbi:uncharacterized protein RAG0_04205 [Rhynchosporium agropyri]|uniref:Transcription factor tau subunit sfc1 n=1 Tax=Rhynchosporium agropyri TaxID=914238 RepID=A0A1E1KBT8_9HELO|nr:uncharacterized protein RAG0_04205 [Rhynchosporium agropyri]
MPRLNRGPARPKQAPIYQIAQREITAVEHPMIVQNLDNGIKSFGRNRPFQRILNSTDAEECVPLYLRQNDPMCTPILSHNTPTNNVLLKITVPKRTGRKRKRGSDGPYEESHNSMSAKSQAPDGSYAPPELVNSVGRQDEPAQILRKLKDNVGQYTVEAVGEIRQTHRYRVMSDFHQSSSNAEFMPKFTETLLTGKIENIRKFKLDERKGWKPMEDIVPPPILSSHALPFNWGWHQAVHLRQEKDTEGNRILVNHSKPEKGGVQYLSHENVKEVPQGPNRDLPTDEATLELIDTLKKAMEERPIWTRRSLLNRVGNVSGIYTFKQAIPFVGYQFKGGPWRDALIKFGVDPRKDKKHRQYQTFFFQFIEETKEFEGEPWRDSRPNFNISKSHGITHTNDDTHVFDGKKLTLDGKIWQACDITVPILVTMMENAPYRDTCENISDGWFCNGTIAKFKGIMKTKLIAIKAKRQVSDSEFENALAIPDIVPDRLSKNIPVPLPDLGLSKEKLDEMERNGELNKSETMTIQRWVRTKKSYKARTERIRSRVSDTPKKTIPRGPHWLKKDQEKQAKKKKGSGDVIADFIEATSSTQPVTIAPRPNSGELPPIPENGQECDAATTHESDFAALDTQYQIDPSLMEIMDSALDSFNRGTPQRNDPNDDAEVPGSSPGMPIDDDEDDDEDDMDSEEERDALASDIDDDDVDDGEGDEGEEDYFSDAREHQGGGNGSRAASTVAGNGDEDV